jgi:hypothetical protein
MNNKTNEIDYYTAVVKAIALGANGRTRDHCVILKEFGTLFCSQENIFKGLF